MKLRITGFVLVLLVLIITEINAQSEIYFPSRFTRAIRMGSAYTGVAEGPEAMFYNTAGLAYNDYYSFLFSSGYGNAFIAEDMNVYDYALVLPVPGEIGTIGFSSVSLNYQYTFYSNFYSLSSRMYSLHYARKITDNLGLGISGNYYHTKVNNRFNLIGTEQTSTYTANSFDVGVSALLRINENLIEENDRFQMGIQLINILNNKIKWDTDAENKPSRIFRYGFSYLYNLNFNDLKIFKLLFAFDLAANGYDYSFIYLSPNFGIELTVIDVFHLSYGRENQDALKNYGSFLYPVNRIGIGVDLVLNKIIKFSEDAVLKIDYSSSNWEKITEDDPEIFFGDGENNKIGRGTFSVSLNVKI